MCEIVLPPASEAITYANINKVSVLYELSKNITILQAIQLLNAVVNQLKPQTIKSCFAKAGFDES